MTQENKPSKQLTLDNLPVPLETNADKSISQETRKQIVITEVTALTQIDDLISKIAFKLSPSKTAFSRLKLELWFEKQRVISLPIRIPEGSLAAEEYEVAPVLNMKGIPAGRYIIKVELYELISFGEKLVQAEKELNVDYLPQTRELRFVKVPTVKSVAGAYLVVISESEVEIYRETEKTTKKGQLKQTGYLVVSRNSSLKAVISFFLSAEVDLTMLSFSLLFLFVLSFFVQAVCFCFFYSLCSYFDTTQATRQVSCSKMLSFYLLHAFVKKTIFYRNRYQPLHPYYFC